MNDYLTNGDRAGIKQAPAAASQPDPFDGLLGLLDELVQFAGEDFLHAGSAIPGGGGCYGPDTAGMDDHYRRVLDEVRRLMGQGKPAKPVQAKPHPAPGILTTHNPAARRFVA